MPSWRCGQAQRRVERRWGAPWSALLLFACVACGGAGTSRGSSPEPARPGAVVNFVFAGLDGRAVTAEQLRGRETVVVLFTTFDPIAQVVTQQLRDLMVRRTPRINVLGVVLEPPANAVLVATYGETLNLGYPLVLADPATIAGEGPLGPIGEIPMGLLLDRAGRTVARARGATLAVELAAALEERTDSERMGPR